MFRVVSKRNICIFLALTFMLASSSFVVEFQHQTHVTLTQQFQISNGTTPILIDSDAVFDATAIANGWDGGGNATHPYLIEGHAIDKLGVAGACISISHTTRHFIIRNCNLTGATYGYQDAGVFLDNVTNGVISENNLHYNEAGVWLDSSSGIVVINNTMIGNDIAGMYIIGAPSNTYTNNSIEGGARLLYSGGNTFINNTLTDGGLDFAGYDLVDFSQTFVSGNTVNGKPLIFLEGQMGGTVLTGAGQVILVDCDSVTVEDQVIESATNGICIYHSPNTVVTNNTLTGNYMGIHTEHSSNLEIFDNNCTANTRWGMYLSYATDAEVYENFCKDNVALGYLGVGIYIPYTHMPTVHNNTCIENDFGIQLYSNTNYALIADNNCSFNTLGINIMSGHDNTVRDNILVENSERGISTTSSSYDNVITQNYLFNNRWGILISQSQSNDVIDNTISAPSVGDSYGVMISQGGNHIVSANEIDVTAYAITLEDSEDNTLNHNNLTNNGYSIFSVNTNRTEIHSNFLVGAWQIGLFLDSTTSDNNVTWNIIMDCAKNGHIDGINNLIDYNYWSNYTGTDGNGDGIGDTFHPIPGDASDADWHPLMYVPEVPTWVEVPMDQYIELGEAFSYDLNATVSSVLGDWSIDDEVNFSISPTGIITNVITLTAGDYHIVVQITDIYDTPLIGTFTVHVVDSVDPEWITVPVDQILEEGETLSYQLEAFDISGFVSWSVNNTLDFTISATGLLESIGILGPGVYPLRITVTDPSDNSIHSEIEIVVNASTTTITPTPTTTSPTDTTTPTPTTPDPGAEGLGYLMLGVGTGCAFLAMAGIYKLWSSKKLVGAKK